MKIGITIDGVIRDFITKFELVYDKYYPVNEIINNVKRCKWILEKKKLICSVCCTNIWIKKDNLCGNETGLYNCDKCKPIKINYKYKYDKNKQIWKYYSKKSRCIKCLKQKWVHVNNTNFDTKICNMCIKLKI